MERIIAYSVVNTELGTTYSPNYRCACKKNAIDGGGKNIYGTDAQFPQNRLIWDVEKNTTSYTVTWVFNDGVTPDKVETNVPQGTSVNSATAGKPATDPTRADYDFAGWYIGNDLLNNQTVTGNITVTAHWTPVTPTIYTIRFVDYDHTEQNPHILSTQNKTWGEAITAPADPTREGYIFSGWASNLSGRTPFNPKKHDVIGDETFTATYGEEIKPIGGTAVTMDNMGQVENTSKGPSDLPQTYHPNGVKVHWWSGPMDGHSSDVGGSDNGISADQSGLNRHAVVSDNITYYHYDGDSCVYEYQVTDPTDPTEMNDINALPQSESAVTTLLTSWTSPNGRFKIESLNPNWIRFAVTHSVQTWASVKTDPDPNKWTYVLDANGNETTLTTYIVIEYYVANNSNANARAGAVKISTSIPNGSSDNNECTITMTKFRTDYSDASTGRHEAGQTYFDEHRTIFYQRGTST